MEKELKVKVYDINWDVDDYEDIEDLPNYLTLSFEHTKDLDCDDELEDVIANELSDTYGFCVTGFNYRRVDDREGYEKVREALDVLNEQDAVSNLIAYIKHYLPKYLPELSNTKDISFKERHDIISEAGLYFDFFDGENVHSAMLVGYDKDYNIKLNYKDDCVGGLLPEDCFDISITSMDRDTLISLSMLINRC